MATQHLPSGIKLYRIFSPFSFLDTKFRMKIDKEKVHLEQLGPVEK